MIPAAECLASPSRQRAMSRAASVTSRIIQAAQLRAGPALVILALGGRTIRSRAAIVVVEAHVIRVAFESGDILALSPSSALGVVDKPAGRVRAPKRGRT